VALVVEVAMHKELVVLELLVKVIVVAIQ